MPSNISISQHGPGTQNVATGSGPQNNSAGSTQNNFFGWTQEHPQTAMATHLRCDPVKNQAAAETPQKENQGGMPCDRPCRREDFRIAIICALPVEYDAVSLLFDKFWDEDDETFGRAQGDTNAYTTGRIGKHDVVLALLPNMGPTAAAGAAAGFRSSYSGVNIVFLVGVCGGVPGTGLHEALLGDVVISKTVRHSQGRQYPNRFITRESVDDALGRPNKRIRGLIASLETQRVRKRLRQKVGQYLKDLQSAAVREQHEEDYRYPGVAQDKLFEADYAHKHQGAESCSFCAEQTNSFCEEAARTTCAELRCDEKRLVPRSTLEAKRTLGPDEVQCPKILIGCIQSGDTVMKSGKHRDQIAKDHGVIAFEMEGAGAWDEMPCIIIKGISDYADSHKNKLWQPFAAATAASVMKAVLGHYDLTDNPRLACS